MHLLLKLTVSISVLVYSIGAGCDASSGLLLKSALQGDISGVRPGRPETHLGPPALLLCLDWWAAPRSFAPLCKKYT